MNRSKLIACMALLLTPSTTLGEQVVRGGGFTLRKTTDGVSVTENDAPVLFYQSEPKQLEREIAVRRAHYVHPLYDLSGNIITEDFPTDHLHHRGIFWAWHQVIANDTPVGDAWICRDFDWDVQDVTISVDDGAAGINAIAVWSSTDLLDGQGRKIPIARDEVEIRIHPRDLHSRAVDFTIRLTALVPDLRIGGSDDSKGYGGFSARIRMPDDLSFISQSGTVEPTTNAVIAANWMQFQSADINYAIFAGENNPGDSRQWILRQKRSMQNPVFPGRKPIRVEPLDATVLRYRVLVLEGNREYDLPKMFAEFQASLSSR